jgi:hypothetical protein
MMRGWARGGSSPSPSSYQLGGSTKKLTLFPERRAANRSLRRAVVFATDVISFSMSRNGQSVHWGSLPHLSQLWQLAVEGLRRHLIAAGHQPIGFDWREPIQVGPLLGQSLLNVAARTK